MKCYICHTQFGGGETVFVNQDTIDKKIYCENDAPIKSIELGQSAAIDVIAARIANNGKEIKEDTSEYETIVGDAVVVNEEENLKIEFEVTKQIKPIIEFGFDALKVKLEKWKEKNKNLVVTEQNLKEMKSFKSDIASERVKIQNFKTEINKVLSKPIKEAKAQIDELIQLIKDVEKPIADGLAVFDEQERQEKKEKVLGFIKESYEEHGLDPNYQNVEVTDRHLLKSTTLKAIKEDIKTKVLEQLEKQTEKKRLAEEQAVERINDINFITISVEQTETNMEVKLNLQKYLDQYENGTDSKQIMSNIHNDSVELVNAQDNAAKAERNRIEQERLDAKRDAQISFEQERQYNQDKDHDVEVPGIIEQNGEKYKEDTGEHVGPSENLFQEQYKNEKESEDHKVDDIRYSQTLPKVYTLSFDVTGTYQQLKLLKDFFDANKESIKYEEKDIQEVKKDDSK